MKNINEHADFLSMLAKHSKSLGERKKLIQMASQGEVNACCEIILNAVKGNFDVPPRLAKLLIKNKKSCKKLLDKKVSLAKKKKILAGQTGGFLPLLIGALAPLLAPIAKGVAKSILT